MFPSNDIETLRQQYASDEALRIRQETHDLYSVPKVDFAAWVLSCLDWRGDETVLDVGCGPGRYYELTQQHLPNTHYYGLDLLPGMLRNHPRNGGILLADAQALPFGDNLFDVVMANHMLFHVPDIDHAIAECRRVLRPEGIFVAATNSVHTMPEFQVLFRRAITLLANPGTTEIHPPVPASNQFALENGTQQLARHFYAVVRHDLPGAFVFPSLEPVMAYLESSRTLSEPQLPEDVYWDDVMMIMREQIAGLINHFGELVVTKLSGVLIATDRGGFIREFIQRRRNDASPS